MLIGAELAVLSVAGIAAAALAMRPLSEQVRERSTLNRDVMLCLDVSGSMKELDESILRQFIDIAAGLPGDRIGLTIWNGAAITVFPLTDDTDYVAATLEFAVDQLNRGARSFVMGTEEGGSSLIGDGLASCVLRFDRLDEERARSIVFATDNALAGDPIVSLHSAAAMARAKDIRVYAVAPANYITPTRRRRAGGGGLAHRRRLPHDGRRSGGRPRDRADRRVGSPPSRAAARGRARRSPDDVGGDRSRRRRVARARHLDAAQVSDAD